MKFNWHIFFVSIKEKHSKAESWKMTVNKKSVFFPSFYRKKVPISLKQNILLSYKFSSPLQNNNKNSVMARKTYLLKVGELCNLHTIHPNFPAQTPSTKNLYTFSIPIWMTSQIY